MDTDFSGDDRGGSMAAPGRIRKKSVTQKINDQPKFEDSDSGDEVEGLEKQPTDYFGL